MRPPLYLLVALLLVCGAGCQGAADTDPMTQTTPETEPAPPAGAPGAGARPGERLIPIPATQKSRAPDRLAAEAATGSFEGIDFDEYASAVSQIVGLIDGYWSENFPPIRGKRYSPPRRITAYYPDTGAPRCEGAVERPRNANYCAARDFIAFDEPGFMIPFYSDVGPTAGATVLAHEWGHVIQARLGLDFPETVEKELNADCLAGAWVADAVEHDVVATSEVEQSTRELLDVGDAPGIPWQAPNAHGTGPQRIAAFTLGRDAGPLRCLTELRPGFSRGRPNVVPGISEK